MRRPSSILGAVGIALAASSPLGAYDSSGGAKIGALLSRVEFTRGGGAEFDPPLFEWTQSKRREAADALAAVFAQMPLDLADLPEIRRLTISNARCSALPDPDLLQEDEDFMTGARDVKKARYLDDCGSDTANYDPRDQSVAISGTMYALSRAPTAEGRKLLARVLQHELTHAWEKDDETRPFYALGYEKRDQEWFEVIRGHGELYEEEEKRADGASAAGRPGALKRLAALQARIRESQDSIFQSLGLPGRYGGATGRIDPRAAPGENPLDTQSMRSRHEYLAILSELLWVDPALAFRQYSPEEIVWVEHRLFKDRPVVAFDRGRMPAFPDAAIVPER
ncbi:MAG: hypothetical protein ACHQ49_09000 [Elusimicrobiota bacterium]